MEKYFIQDNVFNLGKNSESLWQLSHNLLPFHPLSPNVCVIGIRYWARAAKKTGIPSLLSSQSWPTISPEKEQAVSISHLSPHQLHVTEALLQIGTAERTESPFSHLASNLKFGSPWAEALRLHLPIWLIARWFQYRKNKLRRPEATTPLVFTHRVVVLLWEKWAPAHTFGVVMHKCLSQSKRQAIRKNHCSSARGDGLYLEQRMENSVPEDVVENNRHLGREQLRGSC